MLETLTPHIDAFLRYLKDVRGYSEKTVENYAIALKQMSRYASCEEQEGVFTLDITPFRIRIKDLNKKSISAKISAVRSFVRFLRNHRKLRVELKGDDSVKVPKSLPKPIDADYIYEALESATTEERLIVLMLYGLGLRIAELARLELDEISHGWLRVRGKGEKTRDVPLPETVQRSLEAYLSTRAPQTYLFEQDAKPYSTAKVRYLVQKCFKRVGLKATPHQLRHSFATHLLEEGARISDVSELLGHETMATTQVYTKLGSVKKMQEYLKAHPLANLNLGSGDENKPK